MANVKRGKRAGRSFKEKLMSETGSPLTHTVIKATDSSAHPPKTKHVEALIRFTFISEIDNVELCKALVERCKQKSWIPVMKGMNCFHRILRDGEMSFCKYFASQPGPFQLTGFQDMSSAEGPPCSTFIQGYAQYLNLKSRYITKEGFDYCHAASTAEGDKLSSANPPRLFANLDLILHQMRTILNFTSDSHATAIFGNLIVKECAGLLFKDILRLWICANNATVNILEKFFTMEIKNAKEGLRLYEQFVKLCNSTDKFVETCSMVGANNGKQIPTLGEAPKILLPKLRDHVKSGTPASATPKKSTKASKPAAVNDPFDPRGTSSSAVASPSNDFSGADGADLPDLDASANPDNPFL